MAEKGTYGQGTKPTNHIPSGVPTEGTLRFERYQQRWPSDREHKVEELPSHVSSFAIT